MKKSHFFLFDPLLTAPFGNWEKIPGHAKRTPCSIAPPTRTAMIDILLPSTSIYNFGYSCASPQRPVRRIDYGNNTAGKSDWYRKQRSCGMDWCRSDGHLSSCPRANLLYCRVVKSLRKFGSEFKTKKNRTRKTKIRGRRCRAQDTTRSYRRSLMPWRRRQHASASDD